MKSSSSSLASEQETLAGFSTVDDKGRVSLPKSVRTALDVQAGSPLAYIVLENGVLLIPQDEHLAELQQRAIQALADAGVTVQDLLDRLPQALDEVMREVYSREFLAKLKQIRDAEQPELAQKATTYLPGFRSHPRRLLRQLGSLKRGIHPGSTTTP